MMLTDSKIKAAKAQDKRYHLIDGDGLILEVMTSGRKYWRYRYTADGKRSKITIGEYPIVGLGDARVKKEEMRARVKTGLSPLPDESPAGNSFADVASEWLKKAEAKSRSEKEKYNTRRRLELHGGPRFAVLLRILKGAGHV